MAMMLGRIQQHITRYELFQPTDSILVAISGGPDSVFLAYALHKLGYSIGLAHLNYQLRGDHSEAEADLVQGYGGKWGVPCFTRTADPKALVAEKGISLQVACREQRYAFFEELLTREGFTHCATAHHADDQGESVLMSLLFGNSPDVLKGIPRQRGPYVRPLLAETKADILQALAEADLSYRLDATNFDNDYRRNQVRNQLLPLLESLQPNVRTQLLSRYEWQEQQRGFLAKVLEKELNEAQQGELDWRNFVKQYGQEFLPNLVAAVLQQWGLHGHQLWEALRLIDSQPGKWVDSPMGKLVRSRSGLVLNQETAAITSESLKSWVGKRSLHWADTTWELELPYEGDVDWEEVDTYYLDADRMIFPLQWRNWQQGDRMIPLGMRHPKKLSDIFIDEKYPLSAKPQTWVLADQQQIICMQGFRIAEAVKLTATTRRVMRIKRKETALLTEDRRER